MKIYLIRNARPVPRAEWDGDPAQWARAVDAYQRVTTLAPAHAAAWNNLDLLRHRMGQHEERLVVDGGQHRPCDVVGLEHVRHRVHLVARHHRAVARCGGDPSLRWAHLLRGGFTVVPVPGGHYDMWDPPNVEVLASLIAAELAAGR